MNENKNEAKFAYKILCDKLKDFCEENTSLEPVIFEDHYPFRIVYVPVKQVSLFENENVDENGETNDLTVTVGLTTTVKSTLKFKFDADLLKKLIKMAEKTGHVYYHAFREQADPQKS